MAKRVYETFHKNDECYTPAYAVRPLLPYLERFKGRTIWCPFDTNESEFVKVLRGAGHTVVHQHIDDGGNFFDAGDGLFATPVPDFDLIVSNPPFSNKARLVERVIKFGKPFALMLPMTWLNDSAPYRLFAGGGALICNYLCSIGASGLRIAEINRRLASDIIAPAFCRGR